MLLVAEGMKLTIEGRDGYHLMLSGEGHTLTFTSVLLNGQKRTEKLNK